MEKMGEMTMDDGRKTKNKEDKERKGIRGL